MCAGLAVLALGGWKLAGLQYKEVAEVSSWDDALALAQQQRVSPSACPPGVGACACWAPTTHAADPWFPHCPPACEQDAVQQLFKQQLSQKPPDE